MQQPPYNRTQAPYAPQPQQPPYHQPHYPPVKPIKVRCKQGMMEITERGIMLYGPFRRPLASLQRQAITGISLKEGVFSSTVVFRTVGDSEKVDRVNKRAARKIVRMFS